MALFFSLQRQKPRRAISGCRNFLNVKKHLKNVLKPTYTYRKKPKI
jgi:hypothetical protein